MVKSFQNRWLSSCSLPEEKSAFLFFSLFFLVCHILNHKCSGKTVDSSREASDNVTVVTFLSSRHSYKSMPRYNGWGLLERDKWETLYNTNACQRIAKRGKTLLNHLDVISELFTLEWIPIVPFPTVDKSQMYIVVSGIFVCCEKGMILVRTWNLGWTPKTLRMDTWKVFRKQVVDGNNMISLCT